MPLPAPVPGSPQNERDGFLQVGARFIEGCPLGISARQPFDESDITLGTRRKIAVSSRFMRIAYSGFRMPHTRRRVPAVPFLWQLWHRGTSVSFVFFDAKVNSRIAACPIPAVFAGAGLFVLRPRNHPSTSLTAGPVRTLGSGEHNRFLG